MSLPQTLRYQDKVTSAPARSFRTNIQPQSGSVFGLNDTITINIPTRANLVLCPQESYLKFNLVVTNTSGAANTYRLDSCGAHGLFSALRVWSGSNMLEDIQNYNMLAKMLYDLQMPSDNVYNKQNVLAGTRADLAVGTTRGTAAYADVAAVNAAVNNSQLSAYQRNSGELIGANIADGVSTTSRTYCLNLVSLAGSLCPQYLPLFACSSAPLRVELQIVSSILQAMCAVSGTGTISISNVEYVANFIELSDEAVSVIKNASGGMLQFVVPEWRNAVGGLTGLPDNATTQTTTALPFKFSSLKSIFVSQRTSNTAAVRTFPLSSIRNGVSSYTFRIGANQRPTKAPDTITEIFAETLKAIGSIGDTQYNCAIDLDTFSQNTNTAMVIATDPTLNLHSSGSFYIGIDLESFPNAEKSRLYSGYNSNTDDIFVNLSFTNAPNANVRLDAFALYDQVLVFENGTAYARF